MGKKIIYIIVCIVFITGCTNIKDTETKQTNNIENLKKYDLIISNLETSTGEIQLKAGPLNELKDIYNRIAISYNGIVKLYDWQSTTNETYKPLIYYEDINNDSIKEIIINTTLGYGTGLYINKIHVLNSFNLNEYEIENINDYINANITTKINDVLTISIKDKTQVVNIDNFKNDISLYKKASFENYITYEIKNSKLNAIVAVQISDIEFCGNLVFEYDFIDNSFVISNVYYINE